MCGTRPLLPAKCIKATEADTWSVNEKATKKICWRCRHLPHEQTDAGKCIKSMSSVKCITALPRRQPWFLLCPPGIIIWTATWATGWNMADREALLLDGHLRHGKINADWMPAFQRGTWIRRTTAGTAKKSKKELPTVTGTAPPGRCERFQHPQHPWHSCTKSKMDANSAEMMQRPCRSGGFKLPAMEQSLASAGCWREEVDIMPDESWPWKQSVCLPITRAKSSWKDKPADKRNRRLRRRGETVQELKEGYKAAK